MKLMELSCERSLSRGFAAVTDLVSTLAITEADIERHRDALLAKVSLDILVTGNFTRKVREIYPLPTSQSLTRLQRSLEFLSLTEDCLKSRPLLPSEIPCLRSLILPPGQRPAIVIAATYLIYEITETPFPAAYTRLEHHHA